MSKISKWHKKEKNINFACFQIDDRLIARSANQIKPFKINVNQLRPTLCPTSSVLMSMHAQIGRGWLAGSDWLRHIEWASIWKPQNFFFKTKNFCDGYNFRNLEIFEIFAAQFFVFSKMEYFLSYLFSWRA